MFFNLHKLYKKMYIAGIGQLGFSRFIRVNLEGLGANKCNYNENYGKHLDSCFDAYAKFIKRKKISE